MSRGRLGIADLGPQFTTYCHNNKLEETPRKDSEKSERTSPLRTFPLLHPHTVTKITNKDSAPKPTNSGTQVSNIIETSGPTTTQRKQEQSQPTSDEKSKKKERKKSSKYNIGQKDNQEEAPKSLPQQKSGNGGMPESSTRSLSSSSQYSSVGSQPSSDTVYSTLTSADDPKPEESKDRKASQSQILVQLHKI
ncbi:hypothetical protein PoB_007358900 [Plakobranchus ocellatus]|uniref:Uncharacterized protein n=1 Tax=Plakobranchus ocellatus TaxID=259542 RepID=A0AAV4DSW2_9GAST|nr:hypothetical protein PoB_007358900 [Plakobranchus ocellatus]